MATNSAINSSKPIETAKGGTGLATITAHSVLVGNGSSAINPISVGTTGQLLTISGSTPAFSSSANGNFTFTSSTASTNRILTVSNTDNTGSATSSATLQVTTGGSSSGDPFSTYTITGATSFSVGLDNSASDSFKISASTSLGTTDTFVMSTTGSNTLPLQPAFSAYLSSTANNVTGDSTFYTVICDTEIFDIGSNYDNSTGTFTAPVTGKYMLTGSVCQSNLALTTQSNLIIFTSNRAYTEQVRIWTTSAISNVNDYTDCVFADMDSADTATLSAFSAGTTKTVNVVGGAGSYKTRFQGFLVS